MLIALIIIPLIASFISYALGIKSEKNRDVFNVVFMSIELILVILLYDKVKLGSIYLDIPYIMGTGLSLKLDMVRYFLLLITSIVWLLSTMFSSQYLLKYKNRNRYHFFSILTFSATIGVFLSNNIINLFTFFEIMSLTSYILVIHDEDKYSHEAGLSYISMAIAGGLIMLMGIFLLFDYTLVLNLDEIAKKLPYLGSIKYVISTLIIIGFAVKASMFPLHTWLIKAYTAAPAPASAIISAVLLKTGLFGIFIVIDKMMQGDYYLSFAIFIIGIINIYLGGILALMQRNIKRIIAYSSLSQTGFMLMGIGLIGILKDHSSIAIVGSILYMVNHAFFKSLLFFGAGIIYMIYGDLSINKIYGFGKNKWKLKILFLIGILGITGMAGFNGYISKTLIHEALLEAYILNGNIIFKLSEIAFLIGGGLTIAYMMKLYIAIFVDSNEEFIGQYKESIHKRALIPMTVLAGIIIYIGIFPNSIIKIFNNYLLSKHLHIIEYINFFDIEKLTYSLITIIFGIFIYSVFVKNYFIIEDSGKKVYINPSLNWIDLEKHIYIPLIKKSYETFIFVFKIIDNSIIYLVGKITSIVNYIEENVFIAKNHNGSFFIKASSFNVDKFEEKLYLKNSKDNIKLNIQKNISKIQKLEKKSNLEVKKLGEFFIYLNRKITSITYSIFVFGVVLIISLIYVFYFKN